MKIGKWSLPRGVGDTSQESEGAKSGLEREISMKEREPDGEICVGWGLLRRILPIDKDQSSQISP